MPTTKSKAGGRAKAAKARQAHAARVDAEPHGADIEMTSTPTNPETTEDFLEDSHAVSITDSGRGGKTCGKSGKHCCCRLLNTFLTSPSLKIAVVCFALFQFVVSSNETLAGRTFSAPDYTSWSLVLFGSEHRVPGSTFDPNADTFGYYPPTINIAERSPTLAANDNANGGSLDPAPVYTSYCRSPYNEPLSANITDTASSTPFPSHRVFTKVECLAHGTCVRITPAAITDTGVFDLLWTNEDATKGMYTVDNFWTTTAACSTTGSCIANKQIDASFTTESQCKSDNNTNTWVRTHFVSHVWCVYENYFCYCRCCFISGD